MLQVARLVDRFGHAGVIVEDGGQLRLRHVVTGEDGAVRLAKAVGVVDEAGQRGQAGGAAPGKRVHAVGIEDRGIERRHGVAVDDGEGNTVVARIFDVIEPGAGQFASGLDGFADQRAGVFRGDLGHR